MMKHFYSNIYLRILIYTFLGEGYDVFATLNQHIAASQLRFEQYPVWNGMFLVYGLGIPLLIAPFMQLLREQDANIFRYFIFRLLFILPFFYLIEYSTGLMLSLFGIEAWNYNWWMDEKWSLSSGYISWHPLIILNWVLFIFLIENVEIALQAGLPAMKQALRNFWVKN